MARNAVALHNKYSIEELQAMDKALRDDPANANDGVYLYTKKARNKMDQIMWAIHYHLVELKAKSE